MTNDTFGIFSQDKAEPLTSASMERFIEQQVNDQPLNDWERAWLAQHPQYTVESELTERQAADTKLVPCTIHSLRRARATGMLFGSAAPPFKKIGPRVFYTPRLIFEWRRKATSVQSHTGVSS